jgi:hypothetical protein
MMRVFFIIWQHGARLRLTATPGKLYFKWSLSGVAGAKRKRRRAMINKFRSIDTFLKILYTPYRKYLFFTYLFFLNPRKNRHTSLLL